METKQGIYLISPAIRNMKRYQVDFILWVSIFNLLHGHPFPWRCEPGIEISKIFDANNQLVIISPTTGDSENLVKLD